MACARPGLWGVPPEVDCRHDERQYAQPPRYIKVGRERPRCQTASALYMPVLYNPTACSATVTE